MNSRQPTLLQTLTIHNAWANRQMFGALRALDSFATQKGAELIVMALDHIQIVASIFQAHLQGAAHDYVRPQSAVLPSLEQLDRGSQSLDAWYVETAASIEPAELTRARDVRFTDGQILSMTPAEMILHVVTHTIHHRGNIDVVMIQAAMPRRRDGIPDYLRGRRASST